MAKKENTVQFELVQIKAPEFATIEDVFKEKELINVETKFEFGINAELRHVLVRLNVRFLCKKQPFILFKTDCVFRLSEDIFSSYLVEENKIKIPKNILTHFCVLTVGTARGILFGKLEGSNFSSVILPTINVTEMITDDFVINIQE